MSLNPTFGQGITTAALHATLIQTHVQDLMLGKTFHVQQEITKSCLLQFYMNAIDDNKYAQTKGFRPFGTSIGLWFFGKVFQAASFDAIVMNALLDVAHLQRTPLGLLSPFILARIFKTECFILGIVFVCMLISF